MEMCDATLVFSSSQDGCVLFDPGTPNSLDKQLNAVTAFLDEKSSSTSDDSQLASDDGSSKDSPCSELYNWGSIDFNGEGEEPTRRTKRVPAFQRNRKDLIQALRQEVRELTHTIRTLQLKAMQAKAADKTMGCATSPQSLQVWHQIALSQLGLRRKAEAENVHLRDMVNIQMLEAKNLRRILRRRTRIEMMESTLGLKGVSTLTTRTPKTYPCSFHELELDADILFGGVDALFAANGADYSRNVNTDAQRGVYLEVQQKLLLPFSLEAVEKGVWKALCRFGMNTLRGAGGLNAQVNVHPQYTDDEGDTLRTSFVGVVSGIAGLPGSYVRKVSRRYKGQDRYVFIDRLMLDSLLSDGRPGFSDTTSLQVVLEKSGCEGDIKHFSLLKLYFTAERDTPIRSDPFAPFTVAAWTEIVSRFVGDTEAAVLDERCIQ